MTESLRKPTLILVASLAALIVLMPGFAVAHGGLSMEKDMCKLRIGPYMMHFTGYQPEATGTREFCEDIPETGNTIVVLDAVDQVLRTIPLDVRIIEDTGEEPDDIEAITVVHLPATVYPTGSVSLEHDFAKPGRFVGLVTARDADGEYVSRFPFSVAESWNGLTSYLVIIGAIVFGFGLYWYSMNLLKAKAPPGLRNVR